MISHVMISGYHNYTSRAYEKTFWMMSSCPAADDEHKIAFRKVIADNQYWASVFSSMFHLSYNNVLTEHCKVNLQKLVERNLVNKYQFVKVFCHKPIIHTIRGWGHELISNLVLPSEIIWSLEISNQQYGYWVPA